MLLVIHKSKAVMVGKSVLAHRGSYKETNHGSEQS